MCHSKQTRLELEADLTRLLVSVRNAEEAKLVSSCPVAILDVKEPDEGSLGAPDPNTLRQISLVVSEHQAMSFAAGELLQWRPPVTAQTGQSFDHRYGSLLNGFQYVKVGLAGMGERKNWRHDWQSMFQHIPATTIAVVVAYLDFKKCNAPKPEDLIEFAATQPNCSTILFDTYHKSSDLFAHVTPAEIASRIRESKLNGLHTVVAGSVDPSNLTRVVSAKPDFIGVRGAVCRGDRSGQIDRRLVNELASALQALSEN